MDCSPPGSSVHVISQARIPEWVPIPFFPTQGSNLHLLHRRQILYHLSHKGNPLKRIQGLLIRAVNERSQPGEIQGLKTVTPCTPCPGWPLPSPGREGNTLNSLSLCRARPRDSPKRTEIPVGEYLRAESSQAALQVEEAEWGPSGIWSGCP